MMKHTLAILICLAGVADADNPPVVPQLVAPGGAWWKPASRVTVNKPLSLTQATRLEADEVVIEAPIVTNGEALEIFARRLVFTKDGRITGYAGPAPEGIPAPGYTGPAASGPPHSNPGADGAEGKQGNPGLDGRGASGPWPGEVAIFAGEVQGEPKIDGTGQAGGKGGRGGQGQTGGTGGPGRKANARIIGSNSKSTNGGPGGTYGKGGHGGQGGKGGVPVPISILTAWDFNHEPVYTSVKTAPGIGGLRGEAGLPGGPGEGGPGGPGDVARFLFFSSTEPAGSAGPGGAGCGYPAQDPLTAEAKTYCTLGDGSTGDAGEAPTAKQYEEKLKRSTPILTKTFPEFEKKRFEVSLAWFEFHWWRFLELLADGSLPLILDESEAPPGNDTSLEKVLKGRVHRKNLELVRDKWETHFLKPLRQASNLYERDERVATRLSQVVGLATRYTATLTKIQKQGEVARPDADDLRAILDRLQKTRRSSVKEAGETCRAYLTDVLQSETYKQYLHGKQYYYEVPACLELAVFNEEDGVLKPIQIARDVEVKVLPAFAEGVLIENLLPPGVTTSSTRWNGIPNFLRRLGLWEPNALADDLPSQFKVIMLSPQQLNLTQIRDFYPRMSQPVRLAALGVNKGFVAPARSRLTLETLGEYLYSLAVTVGGNPK